MHVSIFLRLHLEIIWMCWIILQSFDTKVETVLLYGFLVRLIVWMVKSWLFLRSKFSILVTEGASSLLTYPATTVLSVYASH